MNQRLEIENLRQRGELEQAGLKEPLPGERHMYAYAEADQAGGGNKEDVKGLKEQIEGLEEKVLQKEGESVQARHEAQNAQAQVQGEE